jgi:hypothetical protein
VQRAAHREYLALQGISHDGIVRAEQYSDELAAARPGHQRGRVAYGALGQHAEALPLQERALERRAPHGSA